MGDLETSSSTSRRNPPDQASTQWDQNENNLYKKIQANLMFLLRRKYRYGVSIAMMFREVLILASFCSLVVVSRKNKQNKTCPNTQNFRACSAGACSLVGRAITLMPRWIGTDSNRNYEFWHVYIADVVAWDETCFSIDVTQILGSVHFTSPFLRLNLLELLMVGIWNPRTVDMLTGRQSKSGIKISRSSDLTERPPWWECSQEIPMQEQHKTTHKSKKKSLQQEHLKQANNQHNTMNQFFYTFLYLRTTHFGW